MVNWRAWERRTGRAATTPVSTLSSRRRRTSSVISGTPPYRFGRAREEGFRQAIAESRYGVPLTHVDARWSDADVTEAMRDSRGDRPPDCGVRGNDEMAFAAYRAAERIGPAIPEDIQRGGFDDEPRAAAATPPLTSVRQPVARHGGPSRRAGQELRQHDDDRFERVELAARSSCADPRFPSRDSRDDSWEWLPREWRRRSRRRAPPRIGPELGGTAEHADVRRSSRA